MSKKVKRLKSKAKFAPRKLSAINYIFYFLLLCVLLFVSSALVVSLYPAKNKLIKKHYVVVVPGASITRKGNPSTALRFRLNKALELYNKKQVKKFYVSGTSFEVLVMKNYLRKNGVTDENIISDIEGKNTYHTIINAQKYAHQHKIRSGIVFVSQRYHLPRITLLARRAKLKNIECISANKKNISNKKKNKFLVRESLALLKAFFFSR